jgi:hypothetical protein
MNTLLGCCVSQPRAYRRPSSVPTTKRLVRHISSSRDGHVAHSVSSSDNNESYKVLPGGGGYWWLQQSTASTTSEESSKPPHACSNNGTRKGVYAIQGEQFVLQRVLTREEQTMALSVFMSNTDLVPLSQRNSSASAQMVLVEQPDRDGQEISECYDPKSPRRTQRVSFTCKLCLERNVNRPVNPEAWKTGSVFIRCHCGAVHKMKDNLKIFHELHGEVFPPVHHRESFLVQEILDRIKDKNSEME